MEIIEFQTDWSPSHFLAFWALTKETPFYKLYILYKEIGKNDTHLKNFLHVVEILINSGLTIDDKLLRFLFLQREFFIVQIILKNRDIELPNYYNKVLIGDAPYVFKNQCYNILDIPVDIQNIIFSYMIITENLVYMEYNR